MLATSLLALGLIMSHGYVTAVEDAAIVVDVSDGQYEGNEYAFVTDTPSMWRVGECVNAVFTASDRPQDACTVDVWPCTEQMFVGRVLTDNGDGVVEYDSCCTVDPNFAYISYRSVPSAQVGDTVVTVCSLDDYGEIASRHDTVIER